MKLRPRDVDHLASLAKLRFDAGGAAAITRDLTRVLEYMRVLDEIETAGVEPMTRGGEGAVPVLRRDEARRGLAGEDALEAAPRLYRGHFLTPKVI